MCSTVYTVNVIHITLLTYGLTWPCMRYLYICRSAFGVWVGRGRVWQRTLPVNTAPSTMATVSLKKVVVSKCALKALGSCMRHVDLH